MERQQATAQRDLSTINAQLSTLTAELASLDTRYRAAAAELGELQAKASMMERRLNSASRLIAGLGSERTRWAADAAKLRERLARLPGDALLAAAFLSYLGPFTFEYRSALLNGDWAPDVAGRGVPSTTPFVLEELLTTESAVQKWVAEGLPADTQSVWNALLTTQSARVPLCVDPQQQAVTWLRAHEGEELRVASLGAGAGDFMQPLKLAVQYGKPFLFEGVDEELDPVIDPVLAGGSGGEGGGGADGEAAGGGQRMVVLDDATLPWDDNFRCVVVVT